MLTNETLTVAAVSAELAALDVEYDQRRAAADAIYKEACRLLRDEIAARRRTGKRLLDVLQAEAGKTETKP